MEHKKAKTPEIRLKIVKIRCKRKITKKGIKINQNQRKAANLKD